MIHNPTNAELLKEFDLHVIGHTKAKKALINLVNRSKTSHYHKYLSHTPSDDIETVNCLLVGPSGTGKTHLVNTLQKIVNFPLIRVDATQLGHAGSVAAMNADKLAKAIHNNAMELSYNKEYPQYHSIEGITDQTIVFIDEIDKISSSFDQQGSNWNKQTQSSLLTLLENTSELKNVSFILAGAFVGLEPKTEEKVSIGFNRDTTPPVGAGEVTDKDIINFGMMPELIGRLNNINVLDTLDYDVMEQILEKTILPQKIGQLSKFMYMKDGFISKEEKKGMIETALDSGQGARSLKREVDKVFSDLEFDYEVVEESKQLILQVEK